MLRTLNRTVATSLSLVLLAQPLFAGLDSKKAAYQGGTSKEKNFPGETAGVEGKLDLSNETLLVFEYKLKKETQTRTYSIPYDRMIDIEYGQKAGRRVAAAIAGGIFISPAMLLLLFSKKRKHFVTIGYKNEEGKDEVAVFELGKSTVRVSLAVLQTRSGKPIQYQDEEARTSSKG